MRYKKDMKNLFKFQVGELIEGKINSGRKGRVFSHVPRDPKDVVYFSSERYRIFWIGETRGESEISNHPKDIIEHFYREAQA